MTTVKRRPKKAAAPAFDLKQVIEDFRENRRLKALAKESEVKANEYRDRLMPVLAAHGQPHGDKGQHQCIELDEPIDGLTKIVRRANTQTFINVDRAEAMAEKGKYLEDIQEGVVVLRFAGTPAEARKVLKQIKMSGLPDTDGVEIASETRFSQERLMAFHQRNRTKLTEKMLDSLYDTETTYTLHPEK